MTSSRCPLCGERPAAWGRHYEGVSIVRCPACRLRFVDPLPDPDAARAVYDLGYFDRPREREDDPSRAPFVRARDDASIDAILACTRVDRPSLLDIGAGTGSFLRRAGDRGAFSRRVAVDVTDVNAAALRAAGVELLVGYVDEVDPGRFDVVAAHHVLEHVPDPKRFLTRLRSFLTAQGLLHLLVPNEGSFTSRVKSGLSRIGVKPRLFRHLAPGHHLLFFEERTLVRLLAATGFRVELLRTRADAKPRGPWQRSVHSAFDALRWNSWLEVVARPNEWCARQDSNL